MPKMTAAGSTNAASATAKKGPSFLDDSACCTRALQLADTNCCGISSSLLHRQQYDRFCLWSKLAHINLCDRWAMHSTRQSMHLATTAFCITTEAKMRVQDVGKQAGEGPPPCTPAVVAAASGAPSSVAAPLPRAVPAAAPAVRPQSLWTTLRPAGCPAIPQLCLDSTQCDTDMPTEVTCCCRFEVRLGWETVAQTSVLKNKLLPRPIPSASSRNLPR